ncbi:hypothetical protein LCGC14_0916010 [marine sediment metagenome]|uniref:TnsA endonuclease N-terminal domain-containing protein n=1 Tax=marine sediment metagenome TaxID=412755 RepID=A0A0F9NS76_9ZZZZ
MGGKVVFEWKNEPQYVQIDGREFKFKSKVEHRWGLYLQYLKDLGAIQSWEYEPTTFEFSERWRTRKQYTPDFFIKEDGEEFYEEIKTSLRQVDILRFRLLKADFPEEKIALVIFGPEHTRKANQNRLRSNARKYVERIVFANPLLKKFGI